MLGCVEGCVGGVCEGGAALSDWVGGGGAEEGGGEDVAEGEKEGEWSEESGGGGRVEVVMRCDGGRGVYMYGFECWEKGEGNMRGDTSEIYSMSEIWPFDS